MSPVSQGLWKRVADRAKRRCEYCKTQEVIVIFMTVDHIVPISAGGQDEFENLCFCCPTCNTYKCDFQTGIDPETDHEVALYNPRQQVWTEHFKWDESLTVLIGLTACGRATIERLRINIQKVVKARHGWVAAGWHPPQD